MTVCSRTTRWWDGEKEFIRKSVVVSRAVFLGAAGGLPPPSELIF